MSQVSAAKTIVIHKRIWRIKPEEEYIWSMRYHKSNIDKVETSGRSETNIGENNLLERQVEIFASFLPDEALVDLDDYSPREIECCLLYAKISGMHPLIERRHTMKGEFKVKLMNQLNLFFGAMVHEVLSNGGDIIRFSPTALIVIWKTGRGSFISQNVHVAIDCALVIQKHYGNFILETGEKVRVDLAITAGPVYFSFIGNDEFSKFILFGAVYEEVRRTRKTVSVDNIIVSPSAMQFIHTFEYSLMPLEDTSYFMVVGLTKLWKQVRRNDYQEVSTQNLELGNASQYTIASITATKSRQSFESEFMLRPSIDVLMDRGDVFVLKAVKFFQEGIRDGLLAGEPIENMLEMRDVTVVSIVISTTILKHVTKWKASDEILTIIYRCQMWMKILGFRFSGSGKHYRICDKHFSSDSFMNSSCSKLKRDAVPMPWVIPSYAVEGIFRYGSKYKGFISYVSILETYIMFNITFGLKGAAHVMQHRSALKCSFGIKNALRDYPKLTSVTLGVGTGRAYFTVIGHSLRQDLSLFSRTILETNALALAFTNKIICDQDTFIHSKMKCTCFKLVEENISHVENLPDGLIYEMISDDIDHLDLVHISNQPAIGRHKEIEHCLNLLEEFITSKISGKEEKLHLINAVSIKGYPKEGKTRLLQELLIKAPHDIPVHFFNMLGTEENIPFLLIRKIFSITDDINLCSLSIEKREETLLKLLKDMPRKNILWSINKVFGVNFSESEKFWKLTSREKHDITLYVLQQLCYKVFPMPWLIMVDDVDYADDESWRVMETILRTETFFLIITKNRDYTLQISKISKFVKKTSVSKIKLESLETSYVCGLICQHLKVYAIPPELEYIINKKSHSNMGFIHNMLTNLQQRNFFKIANITYRDMLKEILVNPPVTLLFRLTPLEREKLHVFIAKNGPFDTDEFKRVLWYLFVESFQNESFHHWREKVLAYVMKSDMLGACILQKNLESNDVPEELSMHIRNTQLFERLSYHEQMIMKSCSVLGDAFPRRLLEQVLTNDYYKILAPAVKSFFEAGILCCGQGDFSDGGQWSIIREKCVDPRFDDSLTCKCKGIYIPDRIKTLPDYAYCGLLRFRYPQFRENIYNLLRDDKQNDIHSKVIMILREETKRCRSCGGDSFNWEAFSVRLDNHEQVRKQIQKKKSVSSFQRSFDADIDPLQSALHQFFMEDENFSLRNSTVRAISAGGSHMDISLDISLADQDLEIAPSNIIIKTKMTSPFEISKLKSSIHLVRNFSNCDFTYCECPQILSFYYKEMMVHCKGAGQLMKLLGYMERYAYSCIAIKNISEAQYILKKAMICINDIYETKDPPPIWRKKLMKAKVLTISAKAYREVGLHKQALAQLQLAMEEYDLKFSNNKLVRSLNYVLAKIDKLLTFCFFPEMHTKTLSKSMCDYYNDTAEAMDMFAEALMLQGKLRLAEVVAIKALFRSLSAQTNFIRICNCFSTLISTLMFRKKRNISVAIEVYALRFCFRKTNRVERSELAAVCRLYNCILIGKLSRAELDYSMHMGFIIIRLSASLNDTDSLMFASSCLVSVLIGKLYLQEAANLLLELEFCSDNVDDTVGQIWFHSQALLFHIEVGYCIVPFQQCLSFLEIQAIESVNGPQDDATKRLTILMWLWCLRNEQWERARRFEHFIKFCVENLTNVTVRTVFSVIYILEGFLLLLVYKMDRCNIKEVKELNKTIVSLISYLEHEVRFITVHKPKLYLMKAYYYHINNNEDKAKKYLDKSEELSNRNGGTMTTEYIIHTRKAWNNELPKKKRDFWVEHCEENNMVFYQEFDTDTDEIGHFTLPTPLYL